LRGFVVDGQQAMLALKYSGFPVVAAAAGLALGGGCELMMHCDAIVAHSELQAGFPELNVGIIPGWGGCAQLLLRQQELGGASPHDVAERTFGLIAKCEVSGSALSAQKMGLIRPRDHVMLSREGLLEAAKGLARQLSAGYAPPKPASITVCGEAGALSLRSRIEEMRADRTYSEVDAGIAGELTIVIAGGTSAGGALSEGGIMRLEVDAVIDLAKRPTTLARLEHMRTTNKPLRN
jgi:3-hydroxyacyl-CoA dehydrogenase